MKNLKFSFEEAANRDPTVLETVRNVIVTYKGTLGTPVSLADINKIARVEPITVIANELTSMPELYNITHGILNIYTAYYLQAIAILSADLQDVRILKILDKTNPDRDIKTMLTAGYTSFESYNPSTLSLESLKSNSFSMEWINTQIDRDLEPADPTGDNHIFQKVEYLDKLPTAVGKFIEVKFAFNCSIQSGKKVCNEATIPVLVKLDTMLMPGDTINNILTSTAEEISFSSRFRDAIGGRISFIKDFILCSDLIKAQKKTMMRDPTGVYAQILKRINSSRFYSAVTGNISLAGISSVFVISDENERKVQEKIGGKLTNKTTRKIAFDNTSAMMIAVVDREWERVTIYVRDTDGYAQASFKDFEQMASKDNNNIMDVLKAFSMGHAPSF